MSDQIFDDPPSIELLQWLARGPLQQNLPRAARLWVLLRSLYGELLPETSRLSQRFTYSHWHQRFFALSHPSDGKPEPEHDPTCRCALSLADWLLKFDPEDPDFERRWRQSLQQHNPIPEKTLAQLLQAPLFASTRRTFLDDFKILVEMGWLKQQGRASSYLKHGAWPSRPKPNTVADLTFLTPDLALLANNLATPIGGAQRFFLHVDYIFDAKSDIPDRVEELQSELKRLWASTPTPPVRLTYHSLKQGQTQQRVIVPICVYYVQRAPYLCAFGQVPGTDPIAWYNYRLDRVQQLTPLTWSDPAVPPCLRQRYQTPPLPHPDDIQEAMTAAWGFDFYEATSLLLLRFDREFHDRYIQGTFRHDTFEQVSYAQVKCLILTKTDVGNPRQALLAILAARSSEDAYYQVHYRQNDPNVGMRLRAWRPRVEVLLPWDLRQQVTQEVQQEWALYQATH